MNRFEGHYLGFLGLLDGIPLSNKVFLCFFFLCRVFFFKPDVDSSIYKVVTYLCFNNPRWFSRQISEASRLVCMINSSRLVSFMCQGRSTPIISI